MQQHRTALAIALLVLFFAAKSAWADNDYIVYSPYVVKGQSEVETYGFYTSDSRSDLNTANGLNFSIAHSFTGWWKAELYVAEFNRDPGGSTQTTGYEFENTFQLSDPGEYWADIGLLAAYAYSKQPGTSDSVEFGPLLEKKSGHFDQRLNLIWVRPVGGGSGGMNEFRSSYSISYSFHHDRSTFSPGIEVYSRPNDNAYQLGPVFYGEYRTDTGSELEYSLGVVYGINQDAPEQTLLARLEYEFF
jgi:hypothetical protein